MNKRDNPTVKVLEEEKKIWYILQVLDIKWIRDHRTWIYLKYMGIMWT
jgi:hypothetical protein